MPTDVDPLHRAIEGLSDAFRPVMLAEQGSGKRRAIGTAVVLREGSRRVVVTAEHVVKGPEPKFIGVPGEASLPWPKKHFKLLPGVPGLPDPDLAWATAVAATDDRALRSPIPVGLAHVPLEPSAGAPLFAVGYPASRARTRDGQTLLASELMSAVVELAPASTFAALGLDARVHFALTYRPEARLDLSGTAAARAHPRGLSGGALLLMSAPEQDGQPQPVIPFLIGILTEYHHEPAGTLVATRIDCLLAGLGLARFRGVALYTRIAA